MVVGDENENQEAPDSASQAVPATGCCYVPGEQPFPANASECMAAGGEFVKAPCPPRN